MHLFSHMQSTKKRRKGRAKRMEGRAKRRTGSESSEAAAAEIKDRRLVIPRLRTRVC